jgi:DNA-binding transcriptional regulator YdaS (Cro superfamily)
MDIQTFLKDAPRGTAAAMANRIGVHPVMVSQWVSGAKAIPLDRCAPIEAATDGAVTRRDLRPNDWWIHWPELVTEDHPAPDTAKAA